jgi:hypothetical protein
MSRTMASLGTLVRVWTDVGTKKPIPLLAKVVDKDGKILVIRYLTENKDGIWRYEEDSYEVEDCPESVAEYLKTDLEEDIGFKFFEDGFIKVESDDDYIPDSEDEGSSDEDEEDEDTDEDDEEEAESIEDAEEVEEEEEYSLDE